MPSKLNARDFLNIRQQLIDDLKSKLNDKWTDQSESDELVIILDAVAHIADNLHYYIDYQKKEANLATATHEKNIINAATSYGYNPYMMKAPKGFVKVELSTELLEDLVIPRGFKFSTNDNLIQSSNIIVSCAEDTTIPAGTQEFSVPVYQGQFIKLSIPVSNIEPGYRLTLNSSFIAEEYVALSVNDNSWTRVDDVDTEEKLSRMFSIHISIENNLERYYIKLPYNYTMYVNEDDTFNIEYLETLGKAGTLGSNRVTELVDSLVTTEDRDISNWVVSVSNEESILGGDSRESCSSIKINTVNYLRSLESLVSIDDYTDYASSFLGKEAKAVDWRTAPELVKAPYKIIIIADTDELTRKNLLEEVLKRQARPDEVVVTPPNYKEFSIEADVYLSAVNSGQDVVDRLIRDYISTHIEDNLDYGKSIWMSTFYWSIQDATSDVERVVLKSPTTDVIVNGYEIPKLVSVKLNYITNSH